MKSRTMTDEELEGLLAATLSCPLELMPPPELSHDIWERIDAWEDAKGRSLLARFLDRRMSNGEPVLVLVAALFFGVLSVGLFLAAAYLLAVHSFVFLRVVQLFIGPNVAELRSLVLFLGLMGAGMLLLSSLALSERLFGQRGGIAA